MIVAELSIVPVGEDVSVSRFVRAALSAIEKEGVVFQPTAMGTIIEAGDKKTLFSVVEKASDAVFSLGAKRVVTRLSIDERIDKEISIKSKIDSLERK